LRIRASGSRTFQLYYRYNHKQRRIGLGDAKTTTLEAARQSARKHRVMLDDGEDPRLAKLTKRVAAGLTVEKVATDYIESCRSWMKPVSLTEWQRYLQVHWKPLHSFAVSKVDRAVVADQLRKITKERGEVSANRARTVLSAMYAWAIAHALCEENPVTGTFRHEEKARERTLSDDELVRIWNAGVDDNFGRVTKLLMLTGCRRDEIGGLRWSEIIGLDTPEARIELPGSRTKNGRPHIVPLSGLAVDLLKELQQKRILGRDMLFGVGKMGHGFSGWDKAKKKFDKVCKLKEHWTLHDLRRTAATRMADLGILPHVIEAAINHVSGHKSGVHGIYNRSTYDAEKRDALNRLATHLQVQLANASGANVHKLKAKA
jgi:integrase